jgi:hypothetical protein
MTAEIAVPDTVAPVEPVGFTAVPDPAIGVTLAWEKPVDCDLAGYRLFRKTGAGGVFTLLSSGLIPVGAPGYIDTHPPPGETSWYAVRSEDYGFNLSPFSETVSVLIPPIPVPEGGE